MVHIRLARLGDWERALEVETQFETRSTWQVEERSGEEMWGAILRPARLPRPQKVRLPRFPDNVQLRIWEERDVFWVASEGSRILGYLGLLVEAERFVARITDLAVDAGRRREGIGTALVAQAESWAIRQELRQLTIACPLKAEPAMAFLRRLGFVPAGFQDAYWPQQEAAFIFRKRLRR